LVVEKMLCRVGFHRPLDSEVWNDGYHFSACDRCNHTLIRRDGGRWRRVPSRFKVVWRRRAQRSLSIERGRV
jgi:hypothetical protein